MKLRECKSIINIGNWLQDKGISPSEHPNFGGVHDVHTVGSLHYGGAQSEEDRVRRGLPGLAVDVNDHSISDDAFKKNHLIEDEADALHILFHKILRAAQEHEWPLNEMFFDRKGFIVEQGYEVNHPISGHEDHLHVGFSKARF